ncbi:MAG: outer membrane beta-barrel domain-containing protein [Sorangiineae bacterium NIC37A_2]|nr:MAG: outer membrane beta-barrel domain-containing protein [Sorangiineae bacterium NIC37A_2]
MKYTPIGLLVAAALWAFPGTALAQEVEDTEETEAVEDEGDTEGVEAGDEEDVGLGDICEVDPEACPTLDMKKEAAKPLDETIFAVQQRFIIKKRRFELQPFWGFTLNDQFVSHHAPGLALNYYITEVLAVGINGQFFQPFNNDSAFNAQVRRAARVVVPLTEYQWSAALNFTYVPANGKFAGFQNFIFHYDAYVVGGIGALSTRPIPVVDPDNRNFDWQPNIAFNAGVGLKIFFNRWFAAVLEVRDYIFLDKIENTVVREDNPADTNGWYGPDALTNNVQAQLGVSVFIPFSFEYRLPKAGADTSGGAK